MRFVLILYLLIFTTNSVNASSLESARCSAIFYIMTAVGHVEPNLGKYFTQQGGLSSMMTGIYLGDETNKPVTNGDVNALKSEQIIWIGNQYPSKKTFIQNKIKSCMGWNMAVGKLYQSNKKLIKQKTKFKALLLSGPSPTKTYKYPFNDFSTVRGYIDVAFNKWIENGKNTPNTIKKLLNKK
jgi:hypothetical protein